MIRPDSSAGVTVTRRHAGRAAEPRDASPEKGLDYGPGGERDDAPPRVGGQGEDDGKRGEHQQSLEMERHQVTSVAAILSRLKAGRAVGDG